MNRFGNGILAAILGVLLLVNWHTASSHGGGTPRLTNEPVGPYRLFAWSSPEPLRAGEIHITYALTLLPEGGKPIDETTLFNDLDQVVTGAEIAVTFTPIHSEQGQANHTSGDPIVLFAQPSEINPLYYEIDTVLPDPGTWEISTSVTGDLGKGMANFVGEVGEARFVDWKVVGGVGAAFLFLIYAGRLRSTGPQRRAALDR